MILANPLKQWLTLRAILTEFLCSDDKLGNLDLTLVLLCFLTALEYFFPQGFLPSLAA